MYKKHIINDLPGFTLQDVEYMDTERWKRKGYGCLWLEECLCMVAYRLRYADISSIRDHHSFMSRKDVFSKFAECKIMSVILCIVFFL